jgi:hypothetical protein
MPFLMITRWSGRMAGLMLVGLVMVFAIAEGIPNPALQPVSVRVQLVALASILVGFIVGWFREGVGGGLALLGFALFCGTELSTNGEFPGGAIPLFAVPAVLLTVSALLAGQLKRSQRV